jgi:hypothetical protein
MPDLTGLPALDVFIGMAFLFFLLATVVSSINEVIQTALNARARILTRGIKALLAGDDTAVNEFFGRDNIKRLAKPAGWVRSLFQWVPGVAPQRRPSYLSARAFSLAVLETATPDTGPTVGKNLFDEAEKALRKLGMDVELDDPRRKLDTIRTELERSFDEVMDRASGWYKRYVQWWLVVIAAALTVVLNVNAFVIAERLWKDDALRASVVQQALKTVEDAEDPKTPAGTDTATPKQVADQIDGINELKLPIGWTKQNTKGDWGDHLAGWLVTVAALALGAPFWFDALGKLARLRGAGNREGTAKSDRSAEDRDDPSRIRPATA